MKIPSKALRIMINNDDIASENVEFIAESGGNGLDNEKTTETQIAADYSEDDIKTLDWKEHIRRRPGMYIGLSLIHISEPTRH